MKFFVTLLVLTTLAGCSSFKLGAACYLPYGVSATCTITEVAPTPEAE